MLWINFLHCYQPANTDAHVIKEATEKSYKRIITSLEKHPQAKFTMNFSGCLFLRWKELGYEDLIRRIGGLVKKGQIELVGTAAYHPLLPLVPLAESERQIKENEHILRKFFGPGFKPKGFFLPEMAYSTAVAKLVKSLGYEWIMLDEMAFTGKLGEVDFSKIYGDKHSGLKIVFRNRGYSRSYVPLTVKRLCNSRTGCPEILITATDGELYGLRHEDHKKTFERIMDTPEIETMCTSEYIASRPNTIVIAPIPSTWESAADELAVGKPYILWSDKQNVIQKKLWELADLAYRTIEENKKDINYNWARWHLVRGLASCTFWWASAKDFRLFGPISWSPDEIERGTNELIRAIRALDGEKTLPAKLTGEKIYVKIKQMVWQHHWTYYWKK